MPYTLPVQKLRDQDLDNNAGKAKLSPQFAAVARRVKDTSSHNFG